MYTMHLNFLMLWPKETAVREWKLRPCPVIYKSPHLLEVGVASDLLIVHVLTSSVSLHRNRPRSGDLWPGFPVSRTCSLLWQRTISNGKREFMSSHRKLSVLPLLVLVTSDNYTDGALPVDQCN